MVADDGSGQTRRRELVLVVSGASGAGLAARFAQTAIERRACDLLHLVVTDAACSVLAHEAGKEWGTPAGVVANLELGDDDRRRVRGWGDGDLLAPIASGSHLVAGVVVLPCSAGMAGALAAGISRGLGQRVADVALKQRWPLVIGIRETPMSPILLANLHTLALAGAHIVPPLPAFYLRPGEPEAMRMFADHYCARVLDLLGTPPDAPELRWGR